MTKRNEKSGLKSHEYNARPRQTKVEGGVTLSYWSVRCRRQGMAGEWGLGWFATRRSAEQAFFDWVAKHRATPLAGGGTDKLTDVIQRYIDHVQMMSARPNTILNRSYTAKQLQQFVAATSPALPVGKFDAKVFEAYRDWLLGQDYKPQTVLNAIIGARTMLRWAAGSGLVRDAPKPPKLTVPPRVNTPVFVEDFEKVIDHAPEPLRTFLEPLAETGFRYAEAESMRKCDVDTTAKTVRVTDRDAFKPKREASYRSVPVSDELCDKLALLGTKPEDRLFPTTAKHPYQWWLNRFQAAQKAAGLDGRLTFHDLRRAVADRLRRGSVPLDAYCTYMGHAAITGLRHYATVDDSDLRKAHEAVMVGGRRRVPTATPPASDPV